MNRKRTPLVERFWKKVKFSDMGECWLWMAAKNPNGYGRFGTGEGTKGIGAHRMAWIYTHGPIPDGMHVCHRCDVPSCVNPAHLFLGTHQDNMADMIEKGRHFNKLVRPKSRSHKAITSRQAEVLRFISGFITGNGLAPTIREIGDNFGITPRASFDHVNALERKGYLERYGTTRTARSLRLAKGATVAEIANHAISTISTQGNPQ